MYLKQNVGCSDETLAVIIGRGIVHLTPCAFSCFGGAILFLLNILNSIHQRRCRRDLTVYDAARPGVRSRLPPHPDSILCPRLQHFGYTISESVRQSSVGGSAKMNFVLCQRLVPPYTIVSFFGACWHRSAAVVQEAVSYTHLTLPTILLV